MCSWNQLYKVYLQYYAPGCMVSVVYTLHIQYCTGGHVHYLESTFLQLSASLLIDEGVLE